MNEEKFRRFRQVATLTLIPMGMVTAPLVGFFIGNWLDRWRGTSPWFTVIFLIFGVIAGARQVLDLIRRAGADK